MQSKKLNKGEDSMKTCQIMLFGIGIAAAFELIRPENYSALVDTALVN